ncbi:MAG: ABC transporter permease [Vicinamibacterales bacterium]
MSSAVAPVVEIRPDRAWHDLDVREVWRYRDMLLLLVQRDVVVRYKQTLLGVSWAVLQPLGPMLVFTLIFTRFIQMPAGDHPYPVFVLSGLVPWTFFSASVNGASSSLVSHAHMLSKVYFPRIVLPAAAVLAKLVDLLIGCLLLLALMAAYGIAPSASLALLPLVVAALVVLAFAVGLTVAAINTTYRDAGHALPLVLQLWLFLTPVIYARDVVPVEWRWILVLNPVTGILESFRAVLLAGRIPWVHLGLSSLLACALLVVGLVLFARMEKHLADHL